MGYALRSLCAIPSRFAGIVGVVKMSGLTGLRKASNMPASLRKFALEPDMTIPATNWLQFAGFATKDEFRTPWGVCDLVGVKLSKRYIRSRHSLNQLRPVGNLRRVALLEGIPADREISVSELADKTSHLFSSEELPTALRQLQSDHFVVRSEGKSSDPRMEFACGGSA